MKKSKNEPVVNFEGFVSQFMSNDSEPFAYSSDSIQIYPLSLANRYIKPPVELFRAQYNFFLVFTEGGGLQQIDNATVELRPNDILFIREGHLNGIHSIASGTDGYYIHLSTDILPEVFHSLQALNFFTFNPKFRVDDELLSWILTACRMIERIKSDSRYGQEARISVLRAVVLRLSEVWAKGSSTMDRSYEVAMRFKEVVYENFRENREIRFYAKQLAVSENYLNRCIKKVTKKTPKQHINEMVIAHSKVLLQDLTKDVSEVAFELNFSDPSYFGRLFKSYTHTTPSEFRKRIMHDLSD